jgi:phosphoribosyl 1,2-cyclic phosphodiesterase/DNA-binding response OmpR family regulator
MLVKFWGTRGSLAKPGPATVRYGGNTSCVEVRSAAGTLVVIDCGTGGHALGAHLTRQNNIAVNGHLLISHTHWDHIQGIPFFAPLFTAGNAWDISGPKGLSQSLRATLAGQMEHTYFPITLDQFSAAICYNDLVEGTFSIGDIKVTTRYLNHPALTLGYRLEVDGASVAYCCDHEPHSADLASGNLPIVGLDRRYADFLAGADLVIHDAQYTAAEYAGKIGWGHSSVEYAVRVCKEAGVKKLALTHYDPMRDDGAVDRIIDDVRLRLRAEGSPLETLAAAEGLTLQLCGEPTADDDKPESSFPATTAIDRSALTAPVLLCIANVETQHLLAKAIAAEGLDVRNVTSRDELLGTIQAERPSLVIVEHDAPRVDGIEMVKAVRNSEAAGEIQMPVVVVATEGQQPAADRGGATDWLVLPFTMSYARTKIRAWVLRTACRWVRAQLPGNEMTRLHALHELAILDTPTEERFDRLTRIAAAAFDVPVALVSLIDKDRQWLKSCFGAALTETEREPAFCAHVVMTGQEMVITDTLLDDRFADNPLVINDPRIRFYAGAPLTLDGCCIGTLCLIDTRPRELAQHELTMLRDLRDTVMMEIKNR